MKSCTCLNCGWVYAGVTRAEAQKQIDEFNEMWEKMSLEDREKMGWTEPSSIERYEKCRCGDSYQNFRDSKADDCPRGVTINQIIHFTEGDQNAS